jgi:hypothetical protein
MADDEDKDGADEPWGEGADVPPLIDVENPLAEDDDREDEDGQWVPPIT